MAEIVKVMGDGVLVEFARRGVDQTAIAVISGLTPKMLIMRFML